MYRTALSLLGVDMSAAPVDVEGALGVPTAVALALGPLIHCPDRFFDGAVFDFGTPSMPIEPADAAMQQTLLQVHGPQLAFAHRSVHSHFQATMPMRVRRDLWRRVSAARQGKRVLRLASGDPRDGGQGNAEIDAQFDALNASVRLAYHRTDVLGRGPENTEKALFLAPKLPVIGFAVTGTGALLNKTIKPFEDVNDALDSVSGLSAKFSTALSVAIIGLATASVSARLARFIQTEQADALNHYKQRTLEEKFLTNRDFEDPVEVNDASAGYVSATAGTRYALSVLDYDARDALDLYVDGYSAWTDQIARVLDRINAR